jgi:hypothetical protein
MAKADQMVLVIEVQHSIKRSGRVKLAKLETIKSERGTKSSKRAAASSQKCGNERWEEEKRRK